MGLFDKAKRALKGSKGSKKEVSSLSGIVSTIDATNSRDPQKSITNNTPGKPSRRLGPTVWSPGTSPIVDIVFLHGLTGEPEKTWTADNATEPWPKTLLAEDITNARIITYGYDADVVHWLEPAGQNTVREHAQNLVNDLCSLRARTKTSKQPVLFVAHSLGGLICQDALLLCVNPNEEAQGELLDCTRGVAFMGTPNAGSDFEMFATAVANVISLSFVKKPNTQLLEVLKGRSQVLANIKNGFLTMVRGRIRPGHPEIKIHAFVEELPVVATGHRVVEPDSAVVPGYNSTTIPANHMNMTKFSSKSEVGYERVLGRLVSWVSSIENKSEGPNVTVTRRSATKDLSVQEAMNDPKLGNKYYYRYPKHGDIIQRPELISKITHLTALEPEVGPRICILCGMGGQGKTALAANFCRQAETKHLFLAIFWLDASSEEALKRGLVAIADVVRENVTQIFKSNDERIEFSLRMIESWNRPWLLVLDNYDNPSRFQNLHSYIPNGSHGSILITSRNSNLGSLGVVVEVPPISQKEALSLLYNRIGGADKFPEQEEYALKIVELLGYLPLAIDQAGAYIRRRVNFQLSRFIDEYDEKKQIIWSRAPTVWEYKNVVYTTWEMSFELIDEDEDERLEKSQILTMLSFLDFRNISQEIFRIPRRFAVVPVEIATEPPKWLGVWLTENGDWDWSKLEDLFLDFRELSLLQMSPLGPSTLRLSMHPLISEWIKYRADLKSRRECLLQAIAIVNMCLHAKLQSLERYLISDDAQQQIFQHKVSCTKNLHELQKIDTDFLSNLNPFVDTSTQADQPNNETMLVENDTGQEAAQNFNEAGQALQDDLSKVSFKFQSLLDDENLQYDSAILNWLAPNDSPGKQLSHNLSVALKGTGRWFIDHPVFQEWVQGIHQELWCYGHGCIPNTPTLDHHANRLLLAGSGKTMIASQVAEYLIHLPTSPVVILIYCDHRHREQQTITNILRSLLRQLIQQIGLVPNDVRSHFVRAQDLKVEPTYEIVKSALLDTFRSTNRSIHIIIDGLDELEPHSLKVYDVLKEGLSELAKSASPRILVTSRLFDGLDLVKLQSTTATIKITAAISDSSFRRFVVASLTTNNDISRTIHSFNPELKKKIKDIVLEKSRGSFFLAKWLVEDLSRICRYKLNEEEFENALESLPDSIDNIYKRIIRVQPPEYFTIANQALLWLGFSRRAISLRELQHAIAVNFVESLSDVIDREWLVWSMDVSNYCSGLVRIDEEADVASLTHFSVKEYLYSIKDEAFPGAHTKITKDCLTYLSLDPFQSGPCDDKILPDWLLEYPLAVYAAEFWFQHAREDEYKLMNDILPFLRSAGKYRSWVQILKSVGESKARYLDSPLEDEQLLSVKLTACSTPSEAAKLLNLDLVAAALAEGRDFWW